MNNKIIMWAAVALMLASVLTGALLTHEEFEQKAELKASLVSMAHDQQRIKDSIYTKLRDSIIINHITVYDTIRYMIQDTKHDRFIHPYRIEAQGQLNLLMDKSIYNIQNTYSGNIEFRGWQTYDVAMNHIIYGNAEAIPLVRMIKDSLEYHTGRKAVVTQDVNQNYNIIVKVR